MREYVILCTSSLLNAKEKWEGLFRNSRHKIIYASTLNLSMTDLDCLEVNAIIVETHDNTVEAHELIERLRRHLECPILFVTAHPDESYYLKAYQIGADECISSKISDKLMIAKTNAWLRWSDAARETGIPVVLEPSIQVRQVQLQ